MENQNNNDNADLVGVALGNEPAQPYRRLEEDAQQGLPTRIVEAIRMMARRSVAIIAQILLVLLAVGVMVIVACRWIRYGYQALMHVLWSHMEKMWDLLDVLSPSVDQPERFEKREVVWKTMRAVLDEAQETVNVYAPWHWLSPGEFLILLTCGMVAVVSTYYTLRTCFGGARRIVMRVRGVQFESVRAGSAFTRGTPPGYQVSIGKPGLFIDEHMGYGIRYNSWLVAPKHVVTENGDILNEVVLSGLKGKVLINLVYEQSRALDDLIYIHVTDKQWSMLGASKAKLASEATNQFVSCTGKSGVSSGRLRKTEVRWTMSYTGSTLPGMSGAAYEFKNQVHGIHTGAAGAFNMGISSALIVAETKMLVRQESPNEGDAEQYEPRFLSNDKALWSQIKAIDDLEERYKNNSWADEDADDFDWNQKLDFGEEKRKVKPSKPSVPTVVLASDSATINLKNQNEEASDSSMVVMNEGDHEYLRKLRRERVIERVEELEKRGEGKPSQFVCTFCDMMCRSQVKLQNHVKNSHETPRKTKVVPESAIPADTGVSGKTVKTGSFLEKRSSSLKNSGTTLVKNLSSKKRNNPSQLPEEFQSRMLDSQRSIENSLKKLLEVMVGHHSDTKQN